MKKGLWIFIGLVVIFLIISYNRGKEITEKSNNATENIDVVNAGSVTETQAIAIGCQFVEINVPGANDFSQKKLSQ
jgi:alkyl hydroperoxide reductase subunit AhpF